MEELLTQLKGKTPEGSLIVCLVFLGMALKKTKFPSRFIPLMLFGIGSISYPVIAGILDMDYTAKLILQNMILGGIIGGASVGAHQLLKQTLPSIFNPPNDGDTTIINKNETNSTPSN